MGLFVCLFYSKKGDEIDFEKGFYWRKSDGGFI